MKEALRKVIIRIKEVRELKGLSKQDVVDLCEDSVSPSTVRRILANGSEDCSNFRAYSVNEVFRAVVGTEDIQLTEAEEADLTATEKEVIAENSALKAAVELRDKMIADLEDQVKNLQREKADIQSALDTANIRLETTNQLFKIAMESIGKATLH